MIGRLKNWLGGGGPYVALELGLVAALAALLAHATWTTLTPRAVGASSLAPRSDGRALAATVKPQLLGAATSRAETVANPRLRLVGLMSPDDAPGRAIFALENGKSKAAAVGEAIVPGFVLQEVHRDHVLVSNNGALQRLDLERRARR